MSLSAGRGNVKCQQEQEEVRVLISIPSRGLLR
jgi:hypothetical protein